MNYLISTLYQDPASTRWSGKKDYRFNRFSDRWKFCLEGSDLGLGEFLSRSEWFGHNFVCSGRRGKNFNDFVINFVWRRDELFRRFGPRCLGSNRDGTFEIRVVGCNKVVVIGIWFFATVSIIILGIHFFDRIFFVLFGFRDFDVMSLLWFFTLNPKFLKWKTILLLLWIRLFKTVTNWLVDFVAILIYVLLFYVGVNIALSTLKVLSLFTLSHIVRRLVLYTRFRTLTNVPYYRFVSQVYFDEY